MPRRPACSLRLLLATRARPQCKQPQALPQLEGGTWPEVQSPFPHPHPSRWGGGRPGEQGGGARPPTVHSAEHGAVTVAEAEAVEGPLPADHYGQAPGRSPGGALLASRPLTSPSSAAWLLQWETDPRAPSDGLPASIFNAASRLTYQSPPVLPTPVRLQGARGPGGGSARGNSCRGSPLVPCGRWDETGGRGASREQVTGDQPEEEPPCTVQIGHPSTQALSWRPGQLLLGLPFLTLTPASPACWFSSLASSKALQPASQSHCPLPVSVAAVPVGSWSVLP